MKTFFKSKVLFELTKHRKKAFITCDETCFCWKIEMLLDLEKIEEEEAQK